MHTIHNLVLDWRTQTHFELNAFAYTLININQHDLLELLLLIRVRDQERELNSILPFAC